MQNSQGEEVCSIMLHGHATDKGPQLLNRWPQTFERINDLANEFSLDSSSLTSGNRPYLGFCRWGLVKNKDDGVTSGLLLSITHNVMLPWRRIDLCIALSMTLRVLEGQDGMYAIVKQDWWSLVGCLKARRDESGTTSSAATSILDHLRRDAGSVAAALRVAQRTPRWCSMTDTELSMLLAETAAYVSSDLEVERLG